MFEKTKRFLLESTFSVLLIFFLFHYRLWTGIHTMTADTGDGIGAFKFFSILPHYWNWFEQGGQAFWTELAVYRLQDPLMWPLILISKSLPVSALTQFNVYILLRIAMMGFGFGTLLSVLGFSVYVKQVGTFLALMGSIGSSPLRSIGVLDLLTTVIFTILFFTLYLKQSKRIWLVAISFVLFHASITYHLIHAGLIFLTLAFFGYIFLRSTFHKTLTLLRRDLSYLLFCFLIVSGALISEIIAVKEPTHLPLLRSIRYNMGVTQTGDVIPDEREFGAGVNVFNPSLTSKASDCGTKYSCRYFDPSFFAAALQFDSRWSLTPFITVIGFALSLISILYLRIPAVSFVFYSSLVTLLFAFGYPGPLWPLAQKLLPVLQLVRHTGFFLQVFCLGQIILVCMVLERLFHIKWKLRYQNMFLGAGVAVFFFLLYQLMPQEYIQRKDRLVVLLGLGTLAVTLTFLRKFKASFIVILVCESIFFHRIVVSTFNDFTTEKQKIAIDRNIPDTIVMRERRILNPFIIPRSSTGTTYGFPTAFESIYVSKLPNPLKEKQAINPRFFGLINLFTSRAMVEKRISSTESLAELDEILGVKPYGIFQVTDVFNHSRSPMALRLVGEMLEAEVKGINRLSAYLSIPMDVIDRIEVNGKAVPFSTANDFGVRFALPSGSNKIKIVPHLERRNWIYLFYYGSFIFLTIAFYKELKGVKEENPLSSKVLVENFA